MSDLEFQFDENPRFRQCILCVKWRESCELFKLIENTHLPPAFRTLYNYKCAVCPDCRNKDMEAEVRQYMKEYMGESA